MPDLGRYADVVRYWQAGFDTAWIAQRLKMQEHLVARWVANFREVTRPPDTMTRVDDAIQAEAYDA